MWHIRLEEAQISMRKEHRDRVPAKSIPRQGLANMPRQGIGKRFPGRELAKRPRQGLQNVPRQGTGKRSQAGNWQAFPGRELASLPRQGTGKRPRQGTGKCSQAGNRRRPQAGDSGCSHAGNNPEVPLHRQPAARCVMSLHACLRDEGL